ncbi:MAG TPA: hypothetical protein VIH67_09395 [Candidatus Acidoferrum sp.]
MTSNLFSRRKLFQAGAAAAAAAGVAAIPGAALAPPAQESASELESLFREGDQERFGRSLQNAYLFLDTMMDAYAQGSTTRLSQSYSDEIGLESTAFVYDNAVEIMARLVRGRGQDLARAKVLGNGLLYAQQIDAAADGRVRQAYFVDHADSKGVFVVPSGFPFFFLGSATGDLAWTGMALAQLASRTRIAAYLNGAVRLGNWIFNNTFDTRGAGGYNFTAGANQVKSTEHNIDVFAFFTMLARLAGDSATWTDRADHARIFVDAMFNVPGGFFFTGTAPDGVSVDPNLSKDNIPEDVQDWSFQAFLNSDHAASIDWCKTNLAVTDTPQSYNSDLIPALNNNNLTGNIRVSGVTFATQSMRPPLAENESAESACFIAPSDPFSNQPSPSAVWLEGTAHLAAALLTRRLPRNRDIDGFNGDLDTARILLDNIRVAQNNLGKGQHVGGGQPIIGLGKTAQTIPDGLGVIAATSELNTGFGFSYKRFLHIGATGWYAIAAQAGNPFHLGLGQNPD